MRSGSGRTEAVLSPVGVRKLLHPARSQLREGHDQELGDAIPLLYAHRVLPIQIHSRADDLAAVAGVYEAGRVRQILLFI